MVNMRQFWVSRAIRLQGPTDKAPDMCNPVKGGDTLSNEAPRADIAHPRVAGMDRVLAEACGK
jgi:hypothetical protein